MATLHHFDHPSYCDPRVCTRTGVENVDHRSTPISFKPVADISTQVIVGLARLDSIDVELGHIGQDTVTIELTELDSLTRDGNEPKVGVDLTSADARLLAAALMCAADQLDEVTNRAAGR